MRGHTAAPLNPGQPINGGNNNQLNLPPYPITLSPPAGWESWMPTTGVGASSDTETIIFTAATEATPDHVSVTFHLSGVTSYQGRYMNDKNWEDHRGADLYFAPAAEQDQTLYPDANGKSKITWSGGGENSKSVTASWTIRPVKTPAWIVIPVNIVCNDYAAYGEIQATVSAGGKSRIHKIPKDDEPVTRVSIGGTTFTWRGNKIADAWERGSAYIYWDTTMDRDNPGPRNDVDHGVNAGDGFSVHEEYRGFMIGGEHQRLVPTQKEVLVYSELDGGSIGGYANFHEISILMMQSSDTRSNGILNFSSGGVPGVNTQYRIRVITATFEDANERLRAAGRDEVEEGTLGFCLGTLGDGSMEPVCVILDEEIRDGYNAADAAILLDSTIAHEIGHAVGLGDDYLYRGIPANPPAGEACLMQSDSEAPITFESHRDWHLGTEVVDFHADDLDGDGAPDPQHWEDHWTAYQLHNNHFTHWNYHKGRSNP